MSSMSVCMIVKDEREVIERCLLCAYKVADEIIVVDTGSSDGTADIAEKMGAKVFHFEWCDDFSAARNFSFEQATCEYVMWLDADDVITCDSADQINAMKTALDGKVDTVMMRYDVAFDEKGAPTFSYYRERILKRSAMPRWEGFVHEAISPFGVIVYSEARILHKKLKASASGRNLNIYRKAIARGAALEPRSQYYFARELYYNNFTAEAITAFNAFLTEKNAYIENKISACRDLAVCYRIQENADAALKALTQSFCYAEPRAEICCDIGEAFMQSAQYKLAIYWYKRALDNAPDYQSGGFVQGDYYDYIPNIQLCVCYDRLGNMPLAKEYNERAGKVKPNSKSYLTNLEYFAASQAK